MGVAWLKWLTMACLLPALAITGTRVPAIAGTPVPAPVSYRHDALASIERAGRLRCGTVTNEADYSMASSHGNLAGLARDLCRAVGAALFDQRAPGTLEGYPDDARGLAALREGAIDILFGVTPDAASALPYDVAFAPTAFYDSQGFLVAARSGITAPAQLDGKLLCFLTDTPAETRMLQWGKASGVRFGAHDFSERGEMAAALEGGRCVAVTGDVSMLAAMRAGFSRPSREFPILRQRIMIDPWAPAVRAGEVRLDAVVTDVLAALVESEMVAAGQDVPPAWFGATPGIAATLGMPNGWARRAIAAVGTYGQIFARDLGADSPLMLARGPDALWTQGGLLVPPTLR